MAILLRKGIRNPQYEACCAALCVDLLEPSLVPNEILLKVALVIHNPNQYLINNVHLVYSLSKANVFFQCQSFILYQHLASKATDILKALFRWYLYFSNILTIH